jgi:hypothetical protein
MLWQLQARKPSRRTWRAALFVLGLSAGAARAEWKVEELAPQGKTRHCVLKSDTLQMHDGYQNIKAHLEIDDQKLSVVTESCMDPGYSDIGVQVDRNSFLKMDRIEKERTAVFQSSYRQLLGQLKKGRSVSAQIRFWPTWPTTGRHEAVFSLKGFATAHLEFEKCR